MNEMKFTISYIVGKKYHTEDYADKVEAKKYFDNLVADGIEVTLQAKRK